MSAAQQVHDIETVFAAQQVQDIYTVTAQQVLEMIVMIQENRTVLYNRKNIPCLKYGISMA